MKWSSSVIRWSNHKKKPLPQKIKQLKYYARHISSQLPHDICLDHNWSIHKHVCLQHSNRLPSSRLSISICSTILMGYEEENGGTSGWWLKKLTQSIFLHTDVHMPHLALLLLCISNHIIPIFRSSFCRIPRTF